MATKYTGSNEGVEGLRLRDQDGNPNVAPVTWGELQITGMTLDELLYEMEQTGWLYRPIEEEESYRTRFAEAVRLIA